VLQRATAAPGAATGPVADAGAPPTKINNWLIVSILVTVFCCLPFGIVGIVYAAQVNGKVHAGDIAGAEDMARKAKLWSLWGLGLGGALALFYFLAIFGGLMAGLSNR
jgi:hypothetical protein